MAFTTMPLMVASMNGIIPMNMRGGSRNTGDRFFIFMRPTENPGTAKEEH